MQAFIDLCARHEHNFYKFVHEVHLHDNGLFEKLMGWIEGILEFLRRGPKAGSLDINALFLGATSVNRLDKDIAIKEIDSLIAWQEARKKWHQDKTRQKMAADGLGDSAPGAMAFKSSDFGLDQMDMQEMSYEDESEDEAEMEEDDDLDPIAAERKRRAKKRDMLRRNAGEPQKPEVEEIYKLKESFLAMLRMTLSE